MPHSSFSGSLFSSLLRSVALTLMLALMLGVFATAAAAGDKIIILDPGHGGADPGAIAPSGLQEKKVTLEFAKILKKAISKRKGYDALLTRTKDQWRSLNARMRFAKRHKADLFISIHVDSNPNHYVHGLTVYSLSQKAYKRYSARWARNKRKVSGNGAVLRGVDLTRTLPEVRSMLIDLVQHRNRDLSISLARSVLKKVKRATPLLGKPHRFANFQVLSHPQIPSALIELGFLTNPGERKRLTNRKFQKKLARKIAASLDNFFKGESINSYFY